MASPDLVEGIKWFLVFLGSTTLHEAAHAWTALKLGDDTAARGGQVSLDPLPHIRRAPWGMVVVPLVSWYLGGYVIGWANAPFSVAWALAYPRRAAWMSLAGPAANLLLALVAALLMHVGLEWGWFAQGSSHSPAGLVIGAGPGLADFGAAMLSITLSLNLLLACFNLLPIPPLDGSAIPLLFLSKAAGEKYFALARQPIVTGLGLMLAWQLSGGVFEPVRSAAVKLLGFGR